MGRRQLSAEDTAFLCSETGISGMHVGAPVMVDAGGAGDGFSFERFRQLVIERLPILPQLRWRLLEVPFGLDRPFWVEDDTFDVDRHIRHIAVPSPGGPKQFNELLSWLVPEPLDRRWPLWQLWFIDGLDDGRVCIFQKMHHAIVDGVTGVGLGEVLYDITPEPRPAPTETRLSLRGSRRLSTPELLALGVANVAVRIPYRLLQVPAPLGLQLLTMADLARQRLPVVPPQAPRCSLNGPLSARRRVAFVREPLARIQEVKSAYGVKVNDVILALAASALRRYLLSIDDLPSRPLTTSCPVALRTAVEKDEIGNRVGMMMVSLATNVEDPAERLRAIYANTQAGKRAQQALGAHPTPGVVDLLPPGLVGMSSRSRAMQMITEHIPTISTSVSNVRGPNTPLYVCGARIDAILPTGPLLMGIGLNFGVLTYCGSVDFGITACPERVPDPQFVADGVPLALAELEAAAGIRTGRTAAAEDSAVRPMTRARRPAAGAPVKSRRTA